MGVYERRLMLLEMLSVAKLVTYSRLAQELGVSIETIRTDITALMCLYPIETVRGCNGGVKLADRQHFHRKTLSDDQTAFLIKIRARFDNEELAMLDSIILQLATQ